MRRLAFFYIAFLLVACLMNPSVHAQVISNQDIKLSTIVGRAINRSVYLELSSKFHDEFTPYTLSVIGLDDADFRVQIEDLLLHNRVDASYSPTGQRLCDLARKKRAKSLQAYWDSRKLAAQFAPRFRQAVTCGQHEFAIPMLYYFWGFFYKKDVFRKFDLTPPNTWEEFISIVQVLRQNDTIPVLLGAKNHWPAAAWMSYINLRLHGIKYHRALASGQISFRGKAFLATLQRLKELVRQNAFIEHHAVHAWNDALPLLYRDHAGMILSGSFLLNQIPKHTLKEIGFFPFPVINPAIPRYEEVPVDGILINQNVKDEKLSAALLAFVSEGKTQEWFAESLGYLPAQKDATVTSEPLMRAGAELIANAEGHTQYFDRDAIPGLADNVPRIIANFLANPDIELTIKQLETARIKARKIYLETNNSVAVD